MAPIIFPNPIGHRWFDVADRNAVNEQSVALIETGSSRGATDRLLAELADGRWRPAAWRRFTVDAACRSAEQAIAHPRALAETCLLHGAFAIAAPHERRRWIAASAVLATTHLGLLEARSSLGPATVITLTRANLPAIGTRLGRWLGVAAVATDLLDGHLARRTGTVTALGGYADSLADAAVWSWLAFTDRPSRRVRAAAVGAWLAPVAIVTVISFRTGRMVTPPRPVVLRPAAALQAALALRSLLRNRP